MPSIYIGVALTEAGVRLDDAAAGRKARPSEGEVDPASRKDDARQVQVGHPDDEAFLLNLFRVFFGAQKRGNTPPRPPIKNKNKNKNKDICQC